MNAPLKWRSLSMNKLLLISILPISSLAFCNQAIDIKINKEQVLELKIDNKKFYLVPVNTSNGSVNNEEWLGLQPDRRNPIACEGTLLCYKCCTGHSSVSKQFCDYHSKNWQRGKNCDCEKEE